MLLRCTNPTAASFKNYGGRGIRVCERWLKFENFLADMGARLAGLTLERKNNNGHYEPSNCVWATWRAQARNRRGATTKLNETAVCIIRHASRRGVPRANLAATFGVTSENIGQVINYKTWRL